MDLLKSLKQYINSQKAISFYFMIFGFLLLCLSAGAFFLATDDLLVNGMFWALIFSGIIALLSGLLYGKKNAAIIINNENIYNNNKALFLKNESLRMDDTLKNHSTFQTIFTLIIILVVGVIISFNNPFLVGICIVISLFFSGILIIGAISKPSKIEYYEELREAHNSNFILQDID